MSSATTRTVNEWIKILGAYPEGREAALRVLGDIVAYRSHTRHEFDDAQQLANAMDAWVHIITVERDCEARP